MNELINKVIWGHPLMGKSTLYQSKYSHLLRIFKFYNTLYLT